MTILIIFLLLGHQNSHQLITVKLLKRQKRDISAISHLITICVFPSIYLIRTKSSWFKINHLFQLFKYYLFEIEYHASSSFSCSPSFLSSSSESFEELDSSSPVEYSNHVAPIICDDCTNLVFWHSTHFSALVNKWFHLAF